MHFWEIVGALAPACLSLFVACGRSGWDTPNPIGRCAETRDHFATAVLAYEPSHGGAPAPTLATFADPDAAVGQPDYSWDGGGAVAMGQGGRLSLALSGCAVGRSFDADADLRIHEVGDFVERTFVALRPTAQSREGLPLTDEGWFDAGPTAGATSDIDLDALLPDGVEPTFDAIRVTDDPGQGGWAGGATGADIDAIEIFSAVALHADPP